jgi:hypothetical protein
VLTLPISAVIYADLSSTGLDGLYAQITADGTIVAQAPEPSSMALMGLALLGVGLVRYRKQRG